MLKCLSDILFSQRNTLIVRYYLTYFLSMLFLYASAAKVMSYGTYRNYVITDLNFLPLILSIFAFAVPFLEFFVAAGIFFGKTRKAALMVAVFHFSLMSAFWWYAVDHSKMIDFPKPLAGMMVNLDNLGHLYFNLAMLVIAVATLLISRVRKYRI